MEDAVKALTLIKEVRHTITSYGGDSNLLSNKEIMKLIKKSKDRDDLTERVVNRVNKKRTNVPKGKYSVVMKQSMG